MVSYSELEHEDVEKDVQVNSQKDSFSRADDRVLAFLDALP